MYNRKIISGIVVLLTLGLLVAFIPPAKAQFIIASWDYPDEYGQGILEIEIQENSTGSWVSYDSLDYWESGVYNWTIGMVIKLIVSTTFNSTLTGAGSLVEGKLYQRHNVTVMNDLDATVFSQQNFTYVDAAIENGIYDYVYEVILNFIPLSGAVYTATVIYEVFY